MNKQASLSIPPRDRSQVALPRPAEGAHRVQVANAFSRMFQRNESALEDLAKA